MARTTESAVKAIYKTDLTEAQISPFLQSANTLVTSRCQGFYTVAELAEIEKWLAGHLLSLHSFRVKSQTLGTTGDQVTYFATSSIGDGLASTPEGQFVMQLDYLGKLTKNSGSFDVEVF